MVVKKYRQYLGLTQQDMADILGVSKQSYWNKENERTAFSDSEKVLIKDMLVKHFPEIKIDDIFFSEEVLKSN